MHNNHIFTSFCLIPIQHMFGKGELDKSKGILVQIWTSLKCACKLIPFVSHDFNTMGRNVMAMGLSYKRRLS